MCGIAGILTKTSASDARPRLEACLKKLSHRGPDDEGIESFPIPENGQGFFGHRRLSIIDVATGHQPFHHPDGSVIVFNGEIYNFQSLKEKLEREGSIEWRSQSDTEVLLYWLKSRGTDGLSEIDGMFAFAFWDAASQSLLLSRDSNGEKPLFYTFASSACGESGVAFASELRALLAFFPRVPEPDREALTDFLRIGYYISPQTPFREVRKLEPGQWVRWRAGKAEYGQFWSALRVKETAPLHDDELMVLLRESVRSRLISERPVGVFLSGGVDSSLTAALASQILGPERAHSFSIGFDDPAFDESAFSRGVAEHLKLQHHHKQLRFADVITRLPEILKRALDEPTADSSLIPTMLLSEYAAESVTVAIGGDGGDELFAGYRTHWIHHEVEQISRIPGALFSLRVLLNLVPKFEQKRHWAERDFWIRHLGSVDFFRPAELAELFPGAFDRTHAPLEELWAPAPESGMPKDLVRAISQIDFRFYLGDEVLQKVDRAAMANSLEVRAPLLSRRLVDYGLGLSTSEKVRGREGKLPLRRALAKLVPPEAWNQKKQGFAIPIQRWLDQGLRKEIDEIRSGLEFWGLDPDRAIATAERGFPARRPYRLWMMYVLAFWAKEHAL